MAQSGTLNSYEGAVEFYLNGRLMAQADSVSITVTSGDNPVNTMLGGMSGYSDGPTTVSMDVSAAPLKNGYEFDFEQAVINKLTVEADVIRGGARMKYVGRFMDAKFSGSAADKASISGTFAGKVMGVR